MKTGTLSANIEVDVNYAKTLQSIIDNCNTSNDMYLLCCLVISNVDFYSGENLDENFHKAIPEFSNEYAKEILFRINGLIEENKKLKA